MAEGKRPGGLTALAVLNFVFGGLGAIGVLAFAAMLSVIQQGLEAAASSGEIDFTYTGGPGMIYVAIMISVVSVILLITSGVGYLGQKRFLGRTLGTIYGILGIVGTIFSLTILGTPFTIMTIIGLVYPVLTLILVNTTFKEDLVN